MILERRGHPDVELRSRPNLLECFQYWEHAMHGIMNGRLGADRGSPLTFRICVSFRQGASSHHKIRKCPSGPIEVAAQVRVSNANFV